MRSRRPTVISETGEKAKVGLTQGSADNPTNAVGGSFISDLDLMRRKVYPSEESGCIYGRTINCVVELSATPGSGPLWLFQ